MINVFFSTRVKNLLCLSVVFLLILFLGNCGGKSEEDLIREAIDKAGTAAEDRDASGILQLVSENYSDDEDRDYQAVQELLEKYFKRYYGIVVNSLGTEILQLEPAHAVVETDVVFSSGAAKVFRKAVRFHGECYRFHLEMVKEGENWKVKSASWRFITLDQLYPESTEMIEKLFPNL